MIDILYLIIVAAAGFAAAWFIAKAKFLKPIGLSIDESENLKQELVNLNSELRIKDDRLNLLSDNLVEIKKKLSEKEEQLIIHQKSLVAKDSDLKHLNERLAENKKEVEELQAKFKLEFENLANKIFEEKSGKFTEQNRKNLDQILNPLKDKIQQFEQKVEETHKKDIADRASIQERIKNLIETSNQMSEDAKNLTKALKGDSKTQGNWGELILENILERSGNCIW